MNVLVNPDGTRSKLYRPGINMENLARNIEPVTFYYRPLSGLYTGPQPYSHKFKTELNWMREHGLAKPEYGVNSFGNIFWYPNSR
jgi:hypothetical protein